MPLKGFVDPDGNLRLMSSSKHGNKHTVVDGITFDSKAEAARYAELKLMLRAGTIEQLAVHVPFLLTVGGILIAKYEADFVYYDTVTRVRIVEDVKSNGTKTREYVIKKRLMKAIHNVDITEIMV